VSDKILLVVVGYLIVAFGLGVFIGKAIKRANPCRHVWESRGYGGAGWTVSVCKLCGAREIDPS
jgi:hypothetical protein